MSQQLSGLRSQIDAVDNGIIDLLKQRAELAEKIKIAKTGPIYKPSREASIIERLCGENHTGLPDEAISAIFRQIIGACRNLEQPLAVSFLGPAGTYSHQAAVKLFGSTSRFVPQTSITKAVDAVERQLSDVALLPFENSSEGSITETHRLLLTTPLQIIGEYTMPITHALLSKAAGLKAIKTVYAHPQALGQCRQWLQANLPNATLVGESSNSQAAKRANKQLTAAAIASADIAEQYGLTVLTNQIQDSADNRTRFIALSKYSTESTGNDKTSVICTVRDKPGALHELLGILAKHGISMTRLESQPHPDHIYAFYIDIEGHASQAQIQNALKELSLAAKTCKMLGSYPKE